MPIMVNTVPPPPLLVGIELNPGPGKMEVGKRERVMGFLEGGGTPTEAAKFYKIPRSAVTT